MTPDSTNPRERWLSWLGTLGDLARLRTLRLLEREELGVGELARALQLPQSTVSRHLKPLFEQGWVDKRAEGTQSLYRMTPASLATDMRDLWRMSREHLGSAASFEEDDARLAEVIAARRVDSRTFFGRIGGDWDELRRELFGDAFVFEALLDCFRLTQWRWTSAAVPEKQRSDWRQWLGASSPLIASPPCWQQRGSDSSDLQTWSSGRAIYLRHHSPPAKPISAS